MHYRSVFHQELLRLLLVLQLVRYLVIGGGVWEKYDKVVDVLEGKAKPRSNKLLPEDMREQVKQAMRCLQ